VDSTAAIGNARPRDSVAKVTIAAVALLIVSAATLYILASVVLALALSEEAVVTIIFTTTLTVAIPTVGCLYVVGRMGARHDLGLAYRLAWMCLPVLALGIWMFICIVSLAAAEIV
jgi:hypothetical protein